MAVVDVNLSLTVPKKDHLAVRRPLDMSQLHALKLLTPDPIAVHRPYNHRSWDGGTEGERAYRTIESCTGARTGLLNLSIQSHMVFYSFHNTICNWEGGESLTVNK